MEVHAELSAAPGSRSALALPVSSIPLCPCPFARNLLLRIFLSRRALAEAFGYEFCTHVQAQSLPACLAGGDVLAKAKTGTGKTIGFLIPVIESVSAVTGAGRRSASYWDLMSLSLWHSLPCTQAAGSIQCGNWQPSGSTRLRHQAPAWRMVLLGLHSLSHEASDCLLYVPLQQFYIVVSLLMRADSDWWHQPECRDAAHPAPTASDPCCHPRPMLGPPH
eukprot:1160658-Pelagomonas_calceolata.AAC.3